MCGIGGFFASEGLPEAGIRGLLEDINRIQHHRGPDGRGTWTNTECTVGFAHTRLSILDLDHGHQPMKSGSGNVITFNGEIYNFVELRRELGEAEFRTQSDTEVILKAYDRWGEHCVEKLRGMFAFAIWDSRRGEIFLARDRFGIKPLYFSAERDVFYFASEIKTLLPRKRSVETNLEGLRDYFTFQFCLGAKTLFSGIRQVEPAHCGYVSRDGHFRPRKYWEVQYDIDWNHTEKYFIEQIRQKVEDSCAVHLRSDVEVGSYLSGGIDSSLLASLARGLRPEERFQVFTGKFSRHPRFDESAYARAVADDRRLDLHEKEIVERDFVDKIDRVIYHLDQPVAGPGSFPQYMVSSLVKDHVKVVLGGQGGDEIFGGYARYLIAYFEQCVKGAVDGTMNSGNFVVTYESIIPNLQSLKNYKPLLQEFWSEGIFDDRDQRYFRLIDRSKSCHEIIDWGIFDGSSSFGDFQKLYWSSNVGKEAYFDSMTHFDFKTLLPALLHVEDRMSMAHSIESRVPFVDHEVVELAATIPADIKFQNGELKRLLRQAFRSDLPDAIWDRKDKMGFPVPLKAWMDEGSLLREFLLDTFRGRKARERHYLSKGFDIEKMIGREKEFSRDIWALLSLELWQQQYHDKHESRTGMVELQPSSTATAVVS